MAVTFRFRSKGMKKQNLPAFGERVDASFVAALVGMTRQHVTRLCRAQKIPGAYQSKGGHWRFRWSGELYGWVNANLSGAGVFGAGDAEAWATRAKRIDDELLACAEVAAAADKRARVLRSQLAQCPASASGGAALANYDRYLALRAPG